MKKFVTVYAILLIEILPEWNIFVITTTPYNLRVSASKLILDLMSIHLK